ncbi:MAG: hypothetical protein ACKO2V_15090 [Snowella sp.]
MNSPVNQPIDSLPPVGKAAPQSSPDKLSDSTVKTIRKQPIPPPNHPRQYRAIGLVYGQYTQTEGHLTQGVLTREDGTEIEAVLLGRMISLIKNHIDLTQPHLWVVYPHIRQEDDHLHLQLVGIWEPETLGENEVIGVTGKSDEEQTSGFFSIRGQVAFASSETEVIIVKIRQAPKAEGERPKFFKIKLKGLLPEKPVSRFWDLQAQLVGTDLVLQSATDLGFAASKKPVKRSDKERRNLGKAKANRSSGSRHRQAEASGEKRSAPLPKPRHKSS